METEKSMPLFTVRAASVNLKVINERIDSSIAWVCVFVYVCVCEFLVVYLGTLCMSNVAFYIFKNFFLLSSHLLMSVYRTAAGVHVSICVIECVQTGIQLYVPVYVYVCVCLFSPPAGSFLYWQPACPCHTENMSRKAILI